MLARMQAAGIPADVRAYNILVKGLARAGYLQLLPQVVAEMQARGVRPSAVTFNTLIDAYAREGRLEEAHASLQVQTGIGAEAVS